MNAIDRLKRDHAILRAKLDVLENALNMGPQAWYVLREVSFTLARQLGDHMRREEELVMACRQALNPKVLAEVAVEHRDEPQHLRTINRLFVSQTTQSLDRIRPALTQVIQGLRRHMAEEEAELFLILERTLAEREPVVMATPIPERHLDESMTVNRIVQEFPKTRPVFERLFISVPIEGCTCLDEVAWRHGLEARELLERLEAVVSPCSCTGRGAAESTETVSAESSV